MTLDILLATYQSESFLAAQLDSLFAQECNNFRILARDGGSADNTMAILHEYEEKYPGRLCLLQGSRSGVVENFGELLRNSNAELIMFCDHDDVWMPDKITRTLQSYRRLETKYGTETPLLVFTDAVVVDSKLQIMAPSSFHFQNLDPNRLTLQQLLLQNVPSGNTMLFNRALRKLALPIPPEAAMHDHWIALVACLFGKIEYLPTSTLYYRQHTANFRGAFGFSARGLLKKVCLGRGVNHERLLRCVNQGAALYDRYGDSLPAIQRTLLKEFSRLPHVNFAERRKIIIACGIWKNGLIRNLGMLLWGL